MTSLPVAPRVPSATITSDTSLLADSLVVDVAADVLLPNSINPALPPVQPLEVIFPGGSSAVITPEVVSEVEYDHDVNSEFFTEISNLFSVPSNASVSAQPQRAKKVTGHRLLTSDAIIEQKKITHE